MGKLERIEGIELMRALEIGLKMELLLLKALILQWM